MTGPLGKPHVLFDGVSIAFHSDGDIVPVTDNVSFEIEPGSTLALVGPSGCGKTSLLKALLGELTPQSGEVKIGQLQPSPLRRGAVFQDASVFPWMTARRNVEFALQLSGVNKSAARQDATHWLARMGLDGFGGHYPPQLSGGMRQRVALARALAIEPDILALDEPFGQLDGITRAALNDLYVSLKGPSRPTALLVTHSVEEAVYLANRVVVLSDRPATVIETLDILLPEPRVSAVRYTDAFFAHTKQVSEILQTGIGRGARFGPVEPTTSGREAE